MDKKLRPVHITFAKYVGPTVDGVIEHGVRGLLGKVPVQNPNIQESHVFWPNKNGVLHTGLESGVLVIDKTQFEDLGIPANADFLDYFAPSLAVNTPDLNRLAVVYTPINVFDGVHTECYVYGRYEASRPIGGGSMRYNYKRFWTNWGWMQ